MRLACAFLIAIAAALPAGAQDMRNYEPRKADQVRDRINKAWDARLERMRASQIEAECKAKAKKQYWAIRFNKRRAFVQDCIEQARR
jgi:hypothetical protein